MSAYSNIYHSDLPHRARTVYMYLKDRANPAGQCWPSINTIAADLALSRSTVKRALAELRREGLLVVESRWRENGSHSSNLYRLM